MSASDGGAPRYRSSAAVLAWPRHAATAVLAFCALGFPVWVALAIVAAGACGGEGWKQHPEVHPGAVGRVCRPGDCAGSQVCKADGTFGACTCGGAGTAGNAGTAGRNGGGSAGGAALVPWQRRAAPGSTVGARNRRRQRRHERRARAAAPAARREARGRTGGTAGATAGTTGAGGVAARRGSAGSAGAAGGAGGGAGTAGAAGTGGSAGRGGAGAGGGVCNPVAQTGCGAGQRCAWIYTGQTTGHNACLADGTVNLGGACGYGRAGRNDRLRQLQERHGVHQRRLQDDLRRDAVPDGCPTNNLCGRYAGAPFDLAGTLGIGFCDPTCNPLTQTRDSDGAAACGSPNPSAPTLGCFGPLADVSFTCAPIISTTKTHGVAAGTPTYINSCAPGYLPLRPDSSASSAPVCTAFCRPAATSSASPANAPGQAGSGFTCPDKGAASPNECRYFWWMFEDTNPFMPSPNSNTLGVCFNYPNYRFDSNGDMTLDMVYPSCATLSPTAHNYDLVLTDAEAWGCVAHP